MNKGPILTGNTENDYKLFFKTTTICRVKLQRHSVVSHALLP